MNTVYTFDELPEAVQQKVRKQFPVWQIEGTTEGIIEAWRSNIERLFNVVIDRYTLRLETDITFSAIIFKEGLAEILRAYPVKNPEGWSLEKCLEEVFLANIQAPDRMHGEKQMKATCDMYTHFTNEIVLQKWAVQVEKAMKQWATDRAKALSYMLQQKQAMEFYQDGTVYIK